MAARPGSKRKRNKTRSTVKARPKAKAKTTAPKPAATEGGASRAYYARLPPAARRALEKIRKAIRDAAPGAVEAFSYGIPGFRLGGRVLIWCAGWNHTSLYPINDAFARAHGIDIEGYETSRGTIRFPLSEPPPLALVKRIVEARAAELRAGDARVR